MSNLALIQPQRHDFETCQVVDWLAGLPVIAVPGPGGAVAGSANAGKGSVTITAVDVGADLGGVQIATVGATVGGQTLLTVADLDGNVTAEGVVGLPVYAAGITFTVAQVPGQPALTAADTFAIATLPMPLDVSGLVFTLDARLSSTSATLAIQASSAPADGSAATIAVDGPNGGVGMAVPQATMARCPPSQPAFPYNLFATDPATGRRVIAFYGLITHRAVLLPQD